MTAAMTAAVTAAIVVPTLGRPSLLRLLASVAESTGPLPDEIVLVDDRRDPSTPLLADDAVPDRIADRVRVMASGGAGPARARNVGWRTCGASWIAFLDDDVLVTDSWLADLNHDLDAADPRVVGIQGHIEVPLPARRPTDWERATAGLADARWITADLVYRRAVLAELGGFDERFPRAFREDADLALRVQRAGHQMTVGTRRTVHPVRPAGWWASVRQQRGNADDALMRRVHGQHWHVAAHAGRGRRPMHLATTAAASATVLSLLARRRSAATVTGVAWAALTMQFAWIRIAPGPRSAPEIARMIATSVAIPPSATWHWLRGVLRHRSAVPWRGMRVAAVLVDRDGTLIRDVPYNGDPERVRPMPGARDALDRLRAAGLPIVVVTNQSGIARGLLTHAQVGAVNARIDDLLGPFDGWQICPHVEADGCACRKPRPGLVHAAAARLGVPVERCVLIGDIGSDVDAARAAGAVGVLVPTAATEAAEIRAASAVYDDLGAAVDAVLIGARS